MDNKQRLINETIKKRTYLAIDPKNKMHDIGLAYNSRSLSDTVEECLAEDITIELNENVKTDDIYTRYLRSMKLKQEMQRLVAYEQSLHDAQQQLFLLKKEVAEKLKLINALKVDIEEKRLMIAEKDLEVEKRKNELFKK